MRIENGGKAQPKDAKGQLLATIRGYVRFGMPLSNRTNRYVALLSLVYDLDLQRLYFTSLSDLR